MKTAICIGFYLKYRCIINALLVAGELGFEPRQTESESVVLPLHHSPPKWLILQNFFDEFCNQCQGFANPALSRR
jgi:hypothetical protein